MSVAQPAELKGPVAGNRHPVMAKPGAAPGMPRELEIVLNGPVGPQRLRDDTIVTNGDGWYRTLTPSASSSSANEVLFSNLNMRQSDAELDAEIDALIAEYHQLGLPLSWCVYPWTQPADLGKRLLARGATKTDIQTFLNNTSTQLKGVAGVDVEKIAPGSTNNYEEAFEAYISIMSAGFNLPADEQAFRRRRYYQLSAGPDPCMHLFLARCNGVVAGCCAAVIKEDSAHMTGVHVVPEFQARGVFLSLKAAALTFLRDLGVSLVTGHGNKQSAVWAERFGAKLIYPYSIYQLDPPMELT